MAKIKIHCTHLSGREMATEYLKRHLFEDDIGAEFAENSKRCSGKVTVVPVRAADCRAEGETGMVSLGSMLAHTVESGKPELGAVPLEAALQYLDTVGIDSGRIVAVYLGARADVKARIVFHYFLLKHRKMDCCIIRYSLDDVRLHRMHVDDVLVFAEKTDEMKEREAVLDELVAEAQKLGLGYE